MHWEPPGGAPASSNLSGKLIPLHMRCVPCWLAAVFLVACAGRSTTVVPHSAPIIPESTVILDATTGAPIAPAELLRRAEAADFVLLGEIHDNTLHHQVRGSLLTAARARRPAVVFEQFARALAPIAPPAPGETEEGWLDAHSFDREGWKWPRHAPIVEAAIAHARAIWGSGLSREALRAVVRQGTDAAPPPLGEMIRQAPLDSVEKAAVDRELFAGHCGKLPSAMMPGMRAAQEVRDASMTEALIAAGSAGPAWLIAGNGHVRMDIGVPRLLRRLAPHRHLLVIGIVERGTEDAVPGMAAGRRYDVLIVTPAATREDPCSGL